MGVYAALVCDRIEEVCIKVNAAQSRMSTELMGPSTPCNTYLEWLG